MNKIPETSVEEEKINSLGFYFRLYVLWFIKGLV
jgi:hypothetical protein